MSENTAKTNNLVMWFAFGFLVYFVWASSGIINIVPGLLYIIGPLVIVVGTLYVLVPGVRSKKTETRTGKITFFTTMAGAFLGVIIGIGFGRIL
jgi:hypothetical protein